MSGYCLFVHMQAQYQIDIRIFYWGILALIYAVLASSDTSWLTQDVMSISLYLYSSHHLWPGSSVADTEPDHSGDDLHHRGDPPSIGSEYFDLQAIGIQHLLFASPNKAYEHSYISLNHIHFPFICSVIAPCYIYQTWIVESRKLAAYLECCI